MSKDVEIFVLDKKVRLLQPADGFRTSLDSVMLAAACPAHGGQRVLDMGCGVGGASFCVLHRVPDCHVTGVEIQECHADLARQNISLNGADGRAAFINSDILDYDVASPDERYDHVICNPPYLEAGEYTPSPKERKAKALGHHGTDIDIKDWVDSGFRLLKSRGSLTIIHRADATDRIIQAMGRRFGGIEIIPLWPRSGQSAKRVIVRSLKDRLSPAKIHQGIILHTANGGYTEDAENILREGSFIE